MDDIFMRELVIFLVVLGVFVGAVPVMIKGHFAQPVEEANEAAAASGNAATGGTAARGMSKRRKARQRDAARKAKA